MEIVDLFIDVGDGVILMKLLEIISGEKLGKPNRGRMRVQKIENLNKTLDFLKRKRIQVNISILLTRTGKGSFFSVTFTCSVSEQEADCLVIVYFPFTLTTLTVMDAGT